MTKDEALKMAIEALQNNQTYDWKGNPLTALDEANEKVINACKEALESQEIGDAEIRQMLNDIEYYQKRVEELEQPAQEYDINELIDKITPENLQYQENEAHGIGKRDGQTHNSSNEWNISGTRD